jgi:hypothetical protein
MSSVIVEGNISGTGSVTIAAPNTNSDFTVTLPDNSGTIVTTGTTTGISASALSTGTLAAARLPAGSVIQVVNATYSVQTDFTLSSFVDTGLTATITPSSASNKVLILATQASIFRTGGSGYGELRLVRDSTALGRFAGEFTGMIGGCASIAYLDSPNTTSAITYKTQVFVSAPTFQLQRNSAVSTIALLEIAG